MLLKSLPLVFVLTGVALYTVLGGADFGAGFWQLFAGRGQHGQRIRDHAHHSIGPVWETNHVWLIFVMVIFWTCYPTAFGSIASTLSVPLFIAALGIIFRGATYAFKAGANNSREAGLIDTLFSLSSILTPFALGTVVGGIASNRVPVGNAAGHAFTSWLNPTSILTGVLAVTTSAYLAAVWLAADAQRDRDYALDCQFRRRALGAGAVTGAVAIAGIFVVHADRHKLFHSLLTGRALPAVVASVLAGIFTLVLVFRRRYQPARYTAAIAVAAIIAGWALSRWPTILPGLTIRRAAAPHDTLVAVTICVLGGVIILLPAMGWLFRLALTGRFTTADQTPAPPVTQHLFTTVTSPATLIRTAIASLIAGTALLNIADAPWAHTIGILCLAGFMLLGFQAVVFTTLDGDSSAAG
ncbi:MAG: cytochrome d ubiquinol oxidase subunit II [Solirubrobacterales bacterium]|nr:cytochrome d ubiquinol oxidase subunit II [Solirubrobacterales bacterium]